MRGLTEVAAICGCDALKIDSLPDTVGKHSGILLGVKRL